MGPVQASAGWLLLVCGLPPCENLGHNRSTSKHFRRDQNAFPGGKQRHGTANPTDSLDCCVFAPSGPTPCCSRTSSLSAPEFAHLSLAHVAQHLDAIRSSPDKEAVCGLLHSDRQELRPRFPRRSAVAHDFGHSDRSRCRGLAHQPHAGNPGRTRVAPGRAVATYLRRVGGGTMAFPAAEAATASVAPGSRRGDAITGFPDRLGRRFRLLLARHDSPPHATCRPTFIADAIDRPLSLRDLSLPEGRTE